MADGGLPRAPIWDDVRTLDGKPWRGKIDFISGGFPCQDISLAGAGAGLEGKRSGLYFEILRLAEEIEPTFLFLENVAAIRLRGLDRVVGELSARGYDCRWKMLSAQEVGAPHVRNRWFLLAAHAERINLWAQPGRSSGEGREEALQPRVHGEAQPMADADDSWKLPEQDAGPLPSDRFGDCGSPLANAVGSGLESRGRQSQIPFAQLPSGWHTESGICRVVNGSPHRVDRVKALGNGVVPAQAREAFRSLMWGGPRL